ncbi:iron-containing redox enzyme family protein [[Mycobacterium] wendilense]|uniref:Iron-containing redox enzyme family protein n=1 Tax=[Mycobacterium] wendilense TaxID=3064284 RepID=A0ABN9P8G6_9MYCO|nr:iron-containing redox enzyme family protein [Mycolicibacterium sp. MU0050]CAJ1587022.1 iron-containing redox enzyme family protein [Mycolicibacterium sp. MU0050]
MLTMVDPRLPDSAGVVSAAVLDALRSRDGDHRLDRLGAALADADPYGLDLHLALYVCYELHYRGFADVDPEWEWNPALLALRAQLERRFLAAVRDEVGPIEDSATAADEMAKLAVEPADGTGVSYLLRDGGTWDQLREYFVHGSLYHLKEGDPHAFAIPRLTGQAKASFVAIEFDEYGSGHGSRVHQQLFADLMDAAGLDSSYLGYLNDVPGVTLAVVNLMSLFGLHRRWRAAAVGHFAATEITSPPGSARLVQAMERMGAPDACALFYREHVEADAVHEQVVRTDVVGTLVDADPRLDRDVVFGIRARDVVEGRLAQHLLTSWDSGRSSLLRPLD